MDKHETEKPGQQGGQRQTGGEHSGQKPGGNEKQSDHNRPGGGSQGGRESGSKSGSR